MESKTRLSIGFLVTSILFMPACDWFYQTSKKPTKNCKITKLAKPDKTKLIKKLNKVINMQNYKVQTNLKPSNLNGISKAQIEDHWGLYEGYVKQVNQLINQPQNNKDRFGFEFNGMILHELYFENLKPNPKQPLDNSPLKKAIESNFDSWENWKNDFHATGTTRGIGWAILYLDKSSGNLFNFFIREHGNGHPAGFSPLLVMDVWEHAYMIDHGAGKRKSYIESFWENINWEVVESRLERE